MWRTGHVFFYMADEDGNALRLSRDNLDILEGSLLASGSRMDVGGWQLHLKSMVMLAKECNGKEPKFCFFVNDRSAAFEESHLHEPPSFSDVISIDIIQGTVPWRLPK